MDEYQDEYPDAPRTQPPVPPYCDAWQHYCLRGLIYYDRVVSTSSGAYEFDLDSHDICKSRNRRIPRVHPDDVVIEPTEPFTYPCVSIQPCGGDVDMDFACVTDDEVLGELSQLIPVSLRGIAHDVVIKTDVWRYITGNDCKNPLVRPGWMDSGYRFIQMELTAVFGYTRHW